MKENKEAINLNTPDYLKGLHDGYIKNRTDYFEQYGNLVAELDSQVPRQYIIKTETKSEMYRALKACEYYLCRMSFVDEELLEMVRNALREADGKI